MPSMEYEILLPYTRQDIRELDGIPEIERDKDDAWRLEKDYCARSIRLHPDEATLFEAALEALMKRKPWHRQRELCDLMHRLAFRIKALLAEPEYSNKPQTSRLRVIFWMMFNQRKMFNLDQYQFFTTMYWELETVLEALEKRRRDREAFEAKFLFRLAANEKMEEESLLWMNLHMHNGAPLNLTHLKPKGADYVRKVPKSLKSVDLTPKVKRRWKELMALRNPSRTSNHISETWKYATSFNSRDEPIFAYKFRSRPRKFRAPKSDKSWRWERGDQSALKKRRAQSFDESVGWHPSFPRDHWGYESVATTRSSSSSRKSSTSNSPSSAWTPVGDPSPSVFLSHGRCSSSSPSAPSIPEMGIMPLNFEYFLVIGWFPAEAAEPIERCVRFWSDIRFFRMLWVYILLLRGWRSIISFKTVQGFGLYKCDPLRNAHIAYEPSPVEKATLEQFFKAYNSHHFTDAESNAWAAWAHKNLNNSSLAPCRSQLSLRLILRWSQTRLLIAALIPLILSFAIGMWYQVKYDDPQSAFTIAQYIIAAGAFIIALLAVLSSLKDG